MLHFRSSLALAALAGLLSACGGGGGSSPIPSSGGGSGTPVQQQTAPAKMLIFIPPPSQQNTHFRPNYISAATQSMTVGLVVGNTTTSLVTANLTQSSPNCTVPAGGGLQCATTVQAPFGIDTFAISTYSGLNGTGSVLSTGEVQATLTAGGTEPTVALSLNGVPSTVSVVLGQSELPVGNAGSTSVIVQAYDASNNLIIGPGLFSTPITLAITGDTYHTLSISYGPIQSPPQTSITSPGQVATLNYTGGTNVGSTITPSASGLASARSATFNATGAVLTLFQYYDSLDDIYFEPYGVAALPNGTAAVFLEEEDPEYALGIASPTGMQYVVTGDTTDPYNPGTGEVTFNGGTVVQNMSENLLSEEGYQYNELAALPNGNVAYAAWFEDDPQNASASGLCYEGDLYSGTLGIFNPASKTTTEYVLHGLPEYIQADSNGNVWFVEYSGYCGETYYYGDYYAIGKLSSAGVLTETDFATAGIVSGADGLTTSPDPAAMSITPNGSTMYIADYDNEAIIKVALSGAPTLQAAAVSNNYNVPYHGGMGTGPDGTTAWFTDEESEDFYYYGYIPGTATFTGTSLAEQTFPMYYFYVYGTAYADGSFWSAGNVDDEQGAISRLSNVASGTPVAGYYAMPQIDYDDYQYLYSISAGGGYVWGADEYYGYVDSLQYGAPSTGATTYTRVRQLTTFNVRNRLKPHLAPHRPTHKRAPLSLPRHP
jgi:hypothetical protein